MSTKSFKKKALSLFLSVIVLLSLIPAGFVTASAVTSGKCGENVNWSFNSSTGTLTISGTGDMENYSYDEKYGDYTCINYPWYADYNSIKSVVINSGVTSIGDYSFCYLYNLTRITIPSSVTKVGNSAFRLCDNLSGYINLENVISIGEEAFSRCEDISGFNISDNIIEIGENAFTHSGPYENSSNWQNGVLYIDDCLIEAGIDFNLTSYSIKPGTKIVADDAFYRFTGLTSITIPNSVKSIGNYAFYFCSSLKSVAIPNSVKSIGNKAFYTCSSLKSVAISDSVLSIGDKSFCDCEQLETLTLGKSVTSIGEGAFCFCYKLKNITIPNSVVRIGEDAFFGCDTFTKVVIPNSVTSLGRGAFDCCISLETVDIGSGIKSLTNEDFLYYNLKTVTVRARDFEMSTLVPNLSDALLISYPFSGAYSYCKKYGVRYLSFDCDAGKHAYTSKVVKPTYFATGYTLHTCTNCGSYYKDRTTAKLALKKVNISKLSALKKGFKVTYKKVTGATGYQVQYSTSSKFSKSKTAKTAALNKSVTKLKAKKKYFVRVRSYRTEKGKTVYSSWSSKKSVITK